MKVNSLRLPPIMSTPAHPEPQGLSDLEIEFIRNHKSDDVNNLLLNPGKHNRLNIKKLAAQILARQKALKKLPEWSGNERLIFPPVLSVEQCSSEATAKYKASLVTGKKLVDITGGMGVDCYYMGKKFEQTDYFEEQVEVAGTAAFNFSQLGGTDISVHNENSLDAIAKTFLAADWLYADPARRGSNQEKAVLLSDCSPDILANLTLLFNTAPNILLKTSPLLDIDLAVKQLKNVREVHVVGYENECKELLFILNKELTDEPVQLKSVILGPEGNARHEVIFTRKEENSAATAFSQPLSFLYEPHASVLKAGAFKVLCERFQCTKLAASSHLYTSEKFIANFPGRAFEIRGTCKPDMKEISKFIGGDKANLTLRNFPAKIQDLRKKWRLRDGGDFYLFATTLEDNKKVIIVTNKVMSR